MFGAVSRFAADWRRVLAVALLAPPLYLAYGAVIQQFSGLALVAPELDVGTVLAVIAAGELAALALLGTRWGLRASPVIAVASLLAWPWLYLRVPFGGTDVLIPWAVSLLVGSVELHRKRPALLKTPAGRRGLAVGTVLLLAGIAVQTLTRPYLFDASAPFWWLGAPFVGIPALGLVWVGVAAVVLSRRSELVGPAAVVGAWAIWVTGSFVRNVGRYPLTASDGVALLSDPAADVRAAWVAAAVAVVAVAAVEYGLRHRRSVRTVEARPSD